MAIEKGLYQAPQGIQPTPNGADMEIEIVNPEMVTMDDGSVEVTIIPGMENAGTGGFDENIAETLEDKELNSLKLIYNKPRKEMRLFAKMINFLL